MSRPLRLIFMGTPDFAVPCLQALLEGPDAVTAVVCQPDRPRGRGRKLEPPPVKRLAAANGLPVLQPESVKGPEFLAQLEAFAPDLLIVVAYGRILPAAVLRAAPLGVINVHASLLPRYRGAAPIQWALINGDGETGVSIMQLDAGMDTGPVLLTAREAIRPEDTAGTLAPRLAALGAQTLVQAVAGLKTGQLSPHPQEQALATQAPMLDKALGHLDWTQPAARLHCLIRGCDPLALGLCLLAGPALPFFQARMRGAEQ